MESYLAKLDDQLLQQQKVPTGGDTQSHRRRVAESHRRRVVERQRQLLGMAASAHELNAHLHTLLLAVVNDARRCYETVAEVLLGTRRGVSEQERIRAGLGVRELVHRLEELAKKIGG